jgi:hypothetical protein
MIVASRTRRLWHGEPKFRLVLITLFRVYVVAICLISVAHRTALKYGRKSC